MNSPRKTALVLFIFFLFLFSYTHSGWGFNQYSRMNVLRSIVYHGTISIDTYHGNTADKSFFRGHYYSDKAPGIMFLSLPAFLLSVFILPFFGLSANGGPGWSIADWLTASGSVGTIAALGSVAGYFLCLHFVKNKRRAFVATLAAFIGSLAFPYSTALFSHAATIGLLTIGLWSSITCTERNQRYRMLLAGCVTGFAVSGEYPSIIAALGIFLISVRLGRKATSYFIAGSLFPIMLLLTYNQIVFGSPWSLGYSHLKDWPEMKRGFFGISFSIDWSVIRELLFGSARGFFYWSPFFLLSIIGIPLLFEKNPFLCRIVLLVTILHICLISGYKFWDGGAALGPRHLAAIIPFLLIASSLGISKCPRIGTALATLSIFLMTTATLLEIALPYIPNPIMNYYLPRIQSGDIKNNLGQVVGLRGIWSIVPFFLVLFEGSSRIFLMFGEQPSCLIRKIQNLTTLIQSRRKYP